MRIRLGGQPAGHFPTTPPEPAPKPAEQPSHQRPAAWRSCSMTASSVPFSRRHRGRRPPDQHPVRLVCVGITDAAGAGLASAVLPEAPNERRQVGQMPRRDLHSGSQMLQAIGLDGPRPVIGEDVADPGLLATGEHGAAMVAERAGVGQRGRLIPTFRELWRTSSRV